MKHAIVLAATVCAALGAVAVRPGWLPSDWHLSPPPANVAITGTMPQGLALSPDRIELAVIDAGISPPGLRIMNAGDLSLVRLVPLTDAFGTPVWQNNRTILVPGASANGVFVVDAATGRVSKLDAGEYVSAVALNAGGSIDAANDLSDTLDRLIYGHKPQQFKTGLHPAAIVTSDGTTYVANRGESSITMLPSGESIAVDLHPAALALSQDGRQLYVACSDADTIDVVSTQTHGVVGRIPVGLAQGRGASPNALAVASDGTLYATLGAENAVAEIRDGRVVARIGAGWYPTGVAVDGHSVYVSDGKGEGSHANPDFRPERRRDPQYVATALVGSVRTIARDAFTAETTQAVTANLPAPVPTPAQTVVRANGPIKHVIYIIKENRTYDQVLGDVAGADGDPALAGFGENITPNDHAIVARFGIYDRTFTDAQVSANGHSWSTAAFANDYLERFWPANYGGRRKLYDFEDGAVAAAPGTGYIWNDADAHGVSLRDYGEFVTSPSNNGGEYTSQMKGLSHHVDGRAPGFDLNISDEYRVDEWQREFNQYEKNGNLPQLELIRLPNDHTSGTRPGSLTPQAYVAQNDHALGRILDAISHSRYWASTAVFAIEDDSQNGPDHVDDQRTTFYLMSPYAAPGLHHEHYTTSSVLRTIELLLGLPPMTIYDATAPPIYDGFDLRADLRSYNVLPERIDVEAKNTVRSYGAKLSARMDWTHADDVDDRVLNDILEHVTGTYR